MIQSWNFHLPSDRRSDSIIVLYLWSYDEDEML